MREDETATGEGMPEAPEVAPETPAESPAEAPATEDTAPEAPEAPGPVSAPSATPSGDTVRLFLAGSRTQTSMRFVRVDGSTMVVTRAGLDVPAADADDLIEQARRHGVRLTKQETQ